MNSEGNTGSDRERGKLFIESPPNNGHGIGARMQQNPPMMFNNYNQNVKAQLMENLITVRVYLNINDDRNNEVLKQVFLPQTQALNTT